MNNFFDQIITQKTDPLGLKKPKDLSSYERSYLPNQINSELNSDKKYQIYDKNSRYALLDEDIYHLHSSIEPEEKIEKISINSTIPLIVIISKEDARKKYNNIEEILNYYKALERKDFKNMEKFLHDNVHFIGPLSDMTGKENVIVAAKNFSLILQSIDIRARFAANNQVMFAYDFMFLGSFGKLRASGLFDLKDEKIIRIELFYDGMPFMDKKSEIFS